MLSPNITANLDNLASMGILDYDAAAHIAGTRPRYYGSPKHYVDPIVMTPMDYVTFSQAHGANPFARGGNRSWWNIAKIALLSFGGIYLGGKVFLKAANGVKSFSLKKLFSRNKKAVQNAANTVTNAVNNTVKKPWYKKVGESVSRGWNKLTKKSGGISRIRLRA